MMGIVRMKLLARSYVWWPGIDQAIQSYAQSCYACVVAEKSNDKPNSNLLPWTQATRPFQRIHIDFGFFANYTLLICIDAYSKWLDVTVMSNTTASSLINVLRKFFSIFGLPGQIVSDNGPPFNSHEFVSFCLHNGIKKTNSPSYHPQSNGMAEVRVGNVKNALKKFVIENAGIKLSIQHQLDNFLLKFRETPSTVTHKSPFELVFKYKPRTRLDMLKEHIEPTNQMATSLKNIKTFKKGDKVLYRVTSNSIEKWVPATVIDRIGNVMYMIIVNNISKKVHVDQLKKSKLNEKYHTNVKTNQDYHDNNFVPIDVNNEESLEQLPRRSTRIRKTPDRLYYN